jgi:glutamyl-tRNA synthetase
VVVALCDRVKTLREMAERARVWYAEFDAYEPEAERKHLQAPADAALAAARAQLAAATSWTPAGVDAALKAAALALGLGLGKVAQPLRVAITGSAVSPSIEHTVYLAGRERALARIDRAIGRVRSRAAES